MLQMKRYTPFGLYFINQAKKTRQFALQCEVQHHLSLAGGFVEPYFGRFFKF